MSDEKFKNKYRIKSVRATWHDYGGGAYFITVCTKGKAHYLGEIVETGHAPSLQATPIGQFLCDNLQNISAHYPYAEIPLFVVMPNHWHAVVFIDGDKTPYVRRNGGACSSRDGGAPSLLRETTQPTNKCKILIL